MEQYYPSTIILSRRSYVRHSYEFGRVVFTSLMSASISAQEPTKEEKPLTPAKIEAAEKKGNVDSRRTRR